MSGQVKKARQGTCGMICSGTLFRIVTSMKGSGLKLGSRCWVPEGELGMGGERVSSINGMSYSQVGVFTVCID